MILGIGTDIVAVDRFERWAEYPQRQLQKVFTTQELADCRFDDGKLNTQRLAVRWSAKEAFYKALSATLVNLELNKNEFSFLSSCPYVSVIARVWGVPMLQIDWKVIENLVGVSLPELSCYLSLSHEKTMAVAFVVIEGDKR